MDQLINQLQDYIANSEPEPALKKLQSVFSLSNSELVNDVILILAQYKKLQSDSRKGILDYKQENLTQNRISNAILSLIQELKSNPDRFAEYNSVDQELDQTVLEKTNQALPTGIKDALYERISYVKEKGLHLKALWIDETPARNAYESKLLSSIGLQLDYAASSLAAYTMLQENTYHLILSDIGREGKKDEGLQFHRRLISEGMDIPLIFYVGSADRGRGVPAYAFGITGRVEELGHLVLDLVERG